MILYRLKNLMLEKSVKDNCKITYKHISDNTGISRNTLSRMASSKGNKVSVDTVEKLCNYFNCTPNDLITIYPDEKPE